VTTTVIVIETTTTATKQRSDAFYPNTPKTLSTKTSVTAKSTTAVATATATTTSQPIQRSTGRVFVIVWSRHIKRGMAGLESMTLKIF